MRSTSPPPTCLGLSQHPHGDQPVIAQRLLRRPDRLAVHYVLLILPLRRPAVHVREQRLAQPLVGHALLHPDHVQVRPQRDPPGQGRRPPQGLERALSHVESADEQALLRHVARRLVRKEAQGPRLAQQRQPHHARLLLLVLGVLPGLERVRLRLLLPRLVTPPPPPHRCAVQALDAVLWHVRKGVL